MSERLVPRVQPESRAWTPDRAFIAWGILLSDVGRREVLPEIPPLKDVEQPLAGVNGKQALQGCNHAQG
jgi:hypothetical protein